MNLIPSFSKKTEEKNNKVAIVTRNEYFINFFNQHYITVLKKIIAINEYFINRHLFKKCNTN